MVATLFLHRPLRLRGGAVSSRLPIIRGALKVVASRLFVTRQAPLGWLLRDEGDLPTEVALDDDF